MGEASEPIIKIFGILDITAEVITMLAIIAVVAVISLIVTHNLKERPGRFQNMVETGVEYLDNFFTDLLGKKNARKYFFFLGSLFVFIIFANYSGLIPGVGISRYFKAPTSSLSVTLGLGIVTFVFLQVSAISAGAKHYIKHFLTPIVPLLLLDELIKPASLALRLFGNIFGEEMVIENLYELLPIGAPIIMMALSLLFCAIQAMVYTMLTSSYLQEFIEE
ncbi:MAG: F0F1 ATP synthase subunit A [Clostridia bacterium]|nr:F0F1 ATP synthase subunit A [Clostridia bacterium]MBR5713501.1 F0F1 ATP synthase subunit A [Clostridia bacterium]